MKDKLFVVGVGSSAGGLDALSKLISSLPKNEDRFCVIVAQHLSPSHDSKLTQILSKDSPWPVVDAHDFESLHAGRVYITPPNKLISVDKKGIRLIVPSPQIGPKPNVNTLFTSISDGHGDRSVGIILSGTGSDGSDGIRSIKEKNGLVMVQSPESAKYDGMPQAAIQTGVVDHILPIEQIVQELILHIDLFGSSSSRISRKEFDEFFHKITNEVSNRSGVDFNNYKTSTLLRRLEKRMHALDIKSIDKYYDFLKTTKDEKKAFIDNALINITSFFRDTEAFKKIEQQIKRIIDKKTERDTLRIWAPGCSSGQEAYSIAMIVDRHTKESAKRIMVQIFATDIDEEAITQARLGIYTTEEVNEVPTNYKETYFKTLDNGSLQIDKDLRQTILFSKHDLTSNPPFLKLDMVVCRNVLIYFNSELQDRIIPLFHYTLKEKGILFLGKAETISSYSNLFVPLDGRLKIYEKRIADNPEVNRFPAFQKVTGRKSKSKVGLRSSSRPLTIKDMVKETLYKDYIYPFVVINENMDIIQIGGDVRLFLSLPEGKPNSNIVKMCIPDLRVDMKALILKAIRTRKKEESPGKKIDFFGTKYQVFITCSPLEYSEQNYPMFIIIFKHQKLEAQSDLDSKEYSDEESRKRIYDLERELEDTRDQLQSFVEELELNNEELQSLNEELQASNEEMQSTNEEMETSNEELQSTNEEIQIAYDELRASHEELSRKDTELKKSEANVRTLLNNSLQSFVLINSRYEIIIFNEKARAFYNNTFGINIRSGDSILNYLQEDELQDFHKDVKECLKGIVVEGERKYLTKKGDEVWVRYNYTPHIATDNESYRMISYSTLDITDLKKTKINLSERENLIQSIFDSTDFGVCVTDEHARFVKVNRGYCELYGYDEKELIGNLFTMVVPPENRAAALQAHEESLIAKSEIPAEWKVVRKNGQIMDVLVSAQFMEQANGKRFKITSVLDITETVTHRNMLKQVGKDLKIGSWELNLATNEFIYTSELQEVLMQEKPVKTIDQLIDCFHMSFQESLREQLSKSIEEKRPLEFEGQIVTPSENRKQWIRLTAKPSLSGNKSDRLQGTIKDIHIEKNNSIYQHRKSEILNDITDDIFIVNKKGIIEWYNGLESHSKNKKIADPQGKRISEFLEVVNKDFVFEDFLDQVRINKKESTRRISVKTNKAQTQDLSIRCTPHFDHLDSFDHYTLIVKDISELISLEKESEYVKNTHSNFATTLNRQLGILKLDYQLNVESVNSKAIELIQMKEKDIMGKNLYLILSREMKDDQIDQLMDHINEGKGYQGKIMFRVKEGTSKQLHATFIVEEHQTDVKDKKYQVILFDIED
ncbi:MAG: PAS domain S-box protein [Cyclobacteriaceae bacterium]|nr:PAS domain S-box protein [Cyclobacteriaceae bacterium]MCH8516082.1 PAS domain S-box protein [Cyclobacteriaceae bacterium]